MTVSQKGEEKQNILFLGQSRVCACVEKEGEGGWVEWRGDIARSALFVFSFFFSSRTEWMTCSILGMTGFFS